jgi:hypothetical protein
MDLPKAKAFIESMEPPFLRVDFHFNPTTISFGRTANYKREPNQSGQPDPPAQYLGTQATSLTLQILLDAVEKQPAGDVLREVETILSWTGPLLGTSLFGKATSPPLLLFNWGALTINRALTFVGYLEKVDGTYELFSRDGRPIRAQLTLTLAAGSLGLFGTNPSSRADRTRRRHVLRAGESLHSVAAAVYGDPTAWRRIAEANDIDDPTRIAVGRELLLPDAHELIEATP